MSVTEPQRLALHRAARAALGEEEGDTLMALSPPANTDMATRQDVEHAQALMRAEIADVKAELKADIADVKADLKADIADLKAELKADIAQVQGDLTATKGELKAEIAQVRGELKADIERMGSRSLRWTVGTMLAGNAAVIGILGFLLR